MTGFSVSGSQGKEGSVDTTRISGIKPMSTSLESGPVVHSISNTVVTYNRGYMCVVHHDGDILAINIIPIFSCLSVGR